MSPGARTTAYQKTQKGLCETRPGHCWLTTVNLSRALDKAPHINSGLGWARDVVTSKVDNSENGQGPSGQGKVDEKEMGLLRAVQGKMSSLLKVSAGNVTTYILHAMSH